MRKVMMSLICIFLLSACSADNKGSQSDLENNTNNEGPWEVVSREYRIKGELLIDIKNGEELRMIKVRVTDNLATPGNPVDFDFVGQTLDIHFESPQQSNINVNEKLNLILSITQFAKPDGTVVYGALPERVFFEINRVYHDLNGKTIETNSENGLEKYESHITSVALINSDDSKHIKSSII